MESKLLHLVKGVCVERGDYMIMSQKHGIFTRMQHAAANQESPIDLIWITGHTFTFIRNAGCTSINQVVLECFAIKFQVIKVPCLGCTNICIITLADIH